MNRSAASKWALILLAMAACFPALSGAPCDTDANCPRGQVCSGSKRCEPGVSSTDAGIPVDAGSDAGAIDGGPAGDAGSEKNPNGISCTDPSQCASGNCVDGVCCDTPCNQGCGYCALAGFFGTCQIVRAGFPGVDPSCFPYVCDGAGLACPTSCTSAANCASGALCDAGQCLKQSGQACAQDTQCPPGDYCNGGSCVPQSGNGASCSAADQCSSGNCVSTVCCNNTCGPCGSCATGTCVDANPGGAGSPSCSPYVCTGTAAGCPTSCVVDTNCITGDYCSGGGCVPKLGNGASCSDSRQCSSGYCVAGTCCGSACGACGSCSTGSCVLAGAGTSGSPSCSPYVCNGGANCPTSCAQDGDCISGDFCSGGTCVGQGGNGTSCSGGNQCSSGNCVSGVCCDSGCGPCGTCATGTCTRDSAGSPGSPSCSPYLCSGSSESCPTGCSTDANCISSDYCNGTSCTPKLQDGSSCGGNDQCQSGICASGTCVTTQPNGASCSNAGQCQSGFCVDGYCCNSACGGACDACNVGGSLGTCTVVGAGNAGNPSCSPYVCDGNSASCPTTCTVSSGCGAGFACNTYYQDSDGDGYGNPSVSIQACGPAPSGYVSDRTDCCDSDRNAHPGQSGWFTSADACNSFDYNCDGSNEQEWSSTGCTTQSGGCPSCSGGTGVWEGGVPPCGSTGSFVVACNTTSVNCGPSGTGYQCNPTTTTMTQGCH